MSAVPFVDLHVRSYCANRQSDRHEFAQLVLPVSGELLLEIEGKQKQLDPLHGALVRPGAWHSQCSSTANRSIILDIDVATITQGSWERLLDKPFTGISPAARKLVEYMGIITDQQDIRPAVVNGWVPLLLDTLTSSVAQPTSRLAALLARIEGEPGLPWTTESMARSAGLSISRLHALFRSELDTSPHAWLLAQRINRACEWLAHTDRSIADIALGAGFSDQSTLTRAMRNAMDTTPAAYRRQSRENRPKRQ
ncbi:helix-turn-helix domain-containing protein [Massilia horti]|uniref:AraC family transcriptional regulator n=1 Tax=Massilia horti TaxID=2562153 RepID=A0A4Y9T280_9BURK|nr:AraC family transcriptional regulator [Massilia horti]TFW33147.1 AraC family transcriptional regulator [Massilia horti]